MEAPKKLSRPVSSDKATQAMGSLISEMLMASMHTHKLHLKVRSTGSYAQHKALQEFYEGIQDQLDTLAEQYQGHKMVLLNVGEPVMKNISLQSVENCLDYLDKLYTLISETQSMMTCSSIINEMDNTKGLINSTKYKLKFLS